jgi:hypothetical protein
MMPGNEFSYVTTSADMDGSSALGLIQFCIRFCQAPETMPVFLKWVRHVWPDCPYSDRQIAEQMINVHNLIVYMSRVLAGEENDGGAGNPPAGPRQNDLETEVGP